MVAKPILSPSCDMAGPVSERSAAGAVFFGCGLCSQVFTDKVHLDLHSRHMHDGAPCLCVVAPAPNKLMSELLGRPRAATVSTRIPFSEVARHNRPDDCWVVLNGQVFDLTEFLGRHPAGRGSIQKWAGKDASDIFNSIHQASWLQQYLRPEAFLGQLGLEEDLVTDSFWHSLRMARVEELQEELARVEQLMKQETSASSVQGRKVEDASEALIAAPQRQKSGQERMNDLELRMREASEKEDYAKAASLKKELERLTYHSAEVTQLLIGHPALLGSASKQKQAESPFRHLAAEHPFSGCALCSQVFHDAGVLRVHMEHVHPGAAVFSVPAPLPKLFGEAHSEALQRLSAKGWGIPLSEVARHNTTKDCWVAVNSLVYDLSEIVAHHCPDRNPILAWAGRDASSMWNKIPGRFPSSIWAEHRLRPEMLMGKVGPEPQRTPLEVRAEELHAELRRLEGPLPSTAAPAAEATAPAAGSEEVRFPRLREITTGRVLPQFTRAEVAKHKGPPRWVLSPETQAKAPEPGTEPWLILHNKVYDLTKLLGTHPGGDEVLLSRAGTDATADFELFEHSEKSRVQRDRELLIGELVPEDRQELSQGAADTLGAGVGASKVEKGASSMWALYAKTKALDLGLVLACCYAYMSYKRRRPLPSMTYSRALRHMHLLMGLGLFGTIGAAHAANRSDGLAKKHFLRLHKQTGGMMLLALFARVWLRMRSGIPPRFPGPRLLQSAETQSLRLFYGLMLLLPLSGLLSDGLRKWSTGDDERDDRLATKSLVAHKWLARFFEYVWLPFHLGYTSAYHYSRGRGVVRKVSPFL